jgi:hypothetical protein
VCDTSLEGFLVYYRDGGLKLTRGVDAIADADMLDEWMSGSRGSSRFESGMRRCIGGSWVLV